MNQIRGLLPPVELEHYKERRTEFYTQCIRRGLFVQPYHHWYICYRHTEEDLTRAYDSEVDPRLNYEQSLELAFLIARKMHNGAAGR
jgi:hypothetical protein